MKCRFCIPTWRSASWFMSSGSPATCFTTMGRWGTGCTGPPASKPSWTSTFCTSRTTSGLACATRTASIWETSASSHLWRSTGSFRRATCYDEYLSGLGLRAAGGCKPRQVRKEATVAVRFVCRGSPGAWQLPAPPCGVCASCLEITASGAPDVIEIDAASNRGINEMRELRENVRYQPARDRYKIFIVDEAHQITNEAFNALLKTIEEPPPWAVFVLCTTEAHKIPATIASRCQHFSFRSVDFEDLTGRMAWICQQEGIEADAEALAILAAAGEGSVRDSLSALDQAIACCGAKLNAAELRALLGAFSLESLEKVTQALAGGDSRSMLEVVDELERNGQNLQHFSRELSRYFRNLLVTRVAGADTRLVAASAAQREKLSKIAGGFSEEDLTRYLQLSLV